MTAIGMDVQVAKEMEQTKVEMDQLQSRVNAAPITTEA